MVLAPQQLHASWFTFVLVFIPLPQQQKQHPTNFTFPLISSLSLICHYVLWFYAPQPLHSDADLGHLTMERELCPDTAPARLPSSSPPPLPPQIQQPPVQTVGIPRLHLYYDEELRSLKSAPAWMQANRQRSSTAVSGRTHAGTSFFNN
jgi:hypothetical protein